MLHCQSSGWLSCGLLLSNLIGVTELNVVCLLVDLIPISIREDTFVEENNVGLTTNDAVKQKNAPIEHYQESCVKAKRRHTQMDGSPPPKAFLLW